MPLPRELDVDAVRVGQPLQPAERAAKELAQLVLARQPQRVLEGDRIQRPLRRAVEGEDRPRRIGARLDGHLADGEDVGLELRLVELETVAGCRVPDEPGIAQRQGQIGGEHFLILPRPHRPGGRMEE